MNDYILTSFKLPKHLIGIKQFINIDVYLKTQETEELKILYKHYKKRDYRYNTPIKKEFILFLIEEIKLYLLFPELDNNNILNNINYKALLQNLVYITKKYSKIYINRNYNKEYTN